MKNRHIDAKNIFSFNAYGSIVNVRLGFLDQIHIFEGVAATVLQIVEMIKNEKGGDKRPLYIDSYIERYTNYGNQGGCLERILYAYGHFIYDLVDQVTTMGEQGDLFIMAREAHYVGLPCHGRIDKRGIQILTDALDALQEYEDVYKYSADGKYYTWNDNNEEFLKLFGIEKSK